MIRILAFALALATLSCATVPADASGKPLAISLAPATQTITEGQTATLTLSKSGGGRPSTVRWSTSDGSASGSIVGAGAISVPTVDDSIVNGTRMLIVTATASTGASAKATITVLDNDVPPPPPPPPPPPVTCPDGTVLPAGSTCPAPAPAPPPPPPGPTAIPASDLGQSWCPTATNICHTRIATPLPSGWVDAPVVKGGYARPIDLIYCGGAIVKVEALDANAYLDEPTTIDAWGNVHGWGTGQLWAVHFVNDLGGQCADTSWTIVFSPSDLQGLAPAP